MLWGHMVCYNPLPMQLNYSLKNHYDPLPPLSQCLLLYHPSPNFSPNNVNPTTNTSTPHQHKPRYTIHISNIQPSCLFHLMIRMGLQLKICINWRSTSCGPNNFLQSYASHHPAIRALNKWILHAIDPHHNTRTHVNNHPSLAPSHNMVHLHLSRDQPGPI